MRFIQWNIFDQISIPNLISIIKKKRKEKNPQALFCTFLWFLVYSWEKELYVSCQPETMKPCRGSATLGSHHSPLPSFLWLCKKTHYANGSLSIWLFLWIFFFFFFFPFAQIPLNNRKNRSSVSVQQLCCTVWWQGTVSLPFWMINRVNTPVSSCKS